MKGGKSCRCRGRQLGSQAFDAGGGSGLESGVLGSILTWLLCILVSSIIWGLR